MTQEKKAFPTYKIEVDDFLGPAVMFTREAMRLAKRHHFDVYEMPQAKVTLEFTPTSREGQAALEAFLEEAEVTLFLPLGLKQVEATE